MFYSNLLNKSINNKVIINCYQTLLFYMIIKPNSQSKLISGLNNHLSVQDTIQSHNSQEDIDDDEDQQINKKKLNALALCVQHSQKVCFDNYETQEPNEAKKLSAPYIVPQKDTDMDLKACPTPKKIENIRITEEGLDDWFAQTMNRNLKTMLLAHKDFYIPPIVFEGLQKRYKSIDNEARLQAKNGSVTYFQPDKDKLGNRKFTSKLVTQEPSFLLFDSKMLNPISLMEGTPIQMESGGILNVNGNKSTKINPFLSSKGASLKQIGAKGMMKIREIEGGNHRNSSIVNGGDNSLNSSQIILNKSVKFDSQGTTQVGFADMILNLRTKGKVNKSELIKTRQSIIDDKSKELAYTQKAAHILREKSDICEQEEDELLSNIRKKLCLSEIAKNDMIEQIIKMDDKNLSAEHQLKNFKNDIINQLSDIADKTIKELKSKGNKQKLNPHSRLKNEINNLYKPIISIDEIKTLKSIGKNSFTSLPANSNISFQSTHNSSFYIPKKSPVRLKNSPQKDNISPVKAFPIAQREQNSMYISPTRPSADRASTASGINSSFTEGISPLKNRIQNNRLIVRADLQQNYSSSSPVHKLIKKKTITKNEKSNCSLSPDLKENLVRRFFENNQTPITQNDDTINEKKSENSQKRSISAKYKANLDVEISKKVQSLLDDADIGEINIDYSSAFDEQNEVFNKKLDIKRISLFAQGQSDISSSNNRFQQDMTSNEPDLIKLEKIAENDNETVSIEENAHIRDRRTGPLNSRLDSRAGTASIRMDRPATNSSNNGDYRVGSSSTNSRKKPTERDNVEFWFLRGMIQMNNNNLFNAIDCFKQVLLLDSKYFLCVFNIGCMYERLGDYVAAKKWLNLSLELNFCTSESLYGLALCEFKTLNFKEAYDILLQIEKLSDDIQLNVVYLIALCAKEMKDYERASTYYKIITNKIKENLNKQATNLIFSFLLLSRRETDNQMNRVLLDKFYILEKQYGTEIKNIYLAEYYVKDDGWRSDFIELIVTMFKELNFWKRFPVEFIRQFLPFMAIDVVKADSVYFIKDNEISVITRGNMVVKEHSGDFTSPKILAFYKEGDIIGHHDIDKFIGRRIEVWLYCLTDVELVVIKRKNFLKIWKAQTEFLKFTYLTLANNIDIFKNITDQTMHILCYELFLKEDRKKDEIIYNDNSYMTSQLIKDLSEKNAKRVNGNGSVVEKGNLRGRRDGIIGPYNNVTSITNFASEKKPQKDNNWINLKKIGKAVKSESRGFYLILRGECVIENIEGSIMGLLSNGDYFGEKLIFPTNSVTNFGVIKVKSDIIEMLFVSKKLFHRIPFYEIEMMKKNCQDRKIIKNLQHLYDIKYTKRKL